MLLRSKLGEKHTALVGGRQAEAGVEGYSLPEVPVRPGRIGEGLIGVAEPVCAAACWMIASAAHPAAVSASPGFANVDPSRVVTKEDATALVRAMIDDLRQHSHGWQNVTLERFLDELAAPDGSVDHGEWLRVARDLVGLLRPSIVRGRSACVCAPSSIRLQGGTLVHTVGTVTADLFDAAAMYDEDYLHFFAASGAGAAPTHGAVVGTAYKGESAADIVWRLLCLAPGMSVLDLACGHGVLANLLAARGCQVTGLDSSTVFLDRARADATAMGVDVEYVSGDMRELPPWSGRFDRVVNWTTAFGYFDDATNPIVLTEAARVLRSGGRIAMDLDNMTKFLVSFTPSRITATRENGDMLVDRHRLDPLTGRFEVERTVIRDGRARQLTFVKRLFTFPELRDWLTASGFTSVAGYGEDGQSLKTDHNRMIVIAEVP